MLWEDAPGCGQGCSWTEQGLSSEEPGCSCSVHHGCLCMQVAANIALVKNLTFHGVFWGSYMQNNPPVLQRSLLELVTWLDQGRITVPVSHRCPLLPVSLLERLCEEHCLPSKCESTRFCSSLPALTSLQYCSCLTWAPSVPFTSAVRHFLKAVKARLVQNVHVLTPVCAHASHAS